MLHKKNLSPEQALQKARHYCAYQERAHAEVKERLYGFGLRKAEVEEILSSLISEDYLNEERFATAFAGGHFRMKQWGRVKISHELRKKGVSAHNLKTGLAAIDEEDYRATLQKLAAAKWKQLKSDRSTDRVRAVKTTAYLLQKGYEPALIHAALAALTDNHPESSGNDGPAEG